MLKKHKRISMKIFMTFYDQIFFMLTRSKMDSILLSFQMEKSICSSINKTSTKFLTNSTQMKDGVFIYKSTMTLCPWTTKKQK